LLARTVNLSNLTDIKIVPAIFSVKDNVGNVYSQTYHLNIIPAPIAYNVEINGQVPDATPYFKPGTKVSVTFNVSNSQRANSITVILMDEDDNNQQVAIQTIEDNLGDLVLPMTIDFDNITIPYTHHLSADVIVYYPTYQYPGDEQTEIFANIVHSSNSLIADGVDPDGLPVISATDGSDDYLNADGNFHILSFDIMDADSGVDWTTPQIVFNPEEGITVGVLDTSEAGKAKWNITVDQNIVAQRVTATVTANDKVGNTGTLIRYLNSYPDS
jgi:hypothetical protein